MQFYIFIILLCPENLFLRIHNNNNNNNNNDNNVSEGLALFDAEVRRHFCDTVAIDPSDSEWLQVQLSLSRGGLGLRRLALHCSAAYLASANKAGCSAPLDEFTLQAVALFNSLVPPASSISEESLLEPCLSQKDLSSKIDDHQFDQLLLISTPANRARLLSAASCHASSWLAVIPSRGLKILAWNQTSSRLL